MIVSRQLQRHFNDPTFRFIQRQTIRRDLDHRWRSVLIQPRRSPARSNCDVLGADFGSVRANDGAFYRIAQLAHVAWPRIIAQRFQRVFRDAFGADIMLAAKHIQEMRGQ